MTARQIYVALNGKYDYERVLFALGWAIGYPDPTAHYVGRYARDVTIQLWAAGPRQNKTR
jgi:hypothetical protein